MDSGTQTERSADPLRDSDLQLGAPSGHRLCHRQLVDATPHLNNEIELLQQELIAAISQNNGDQLQKQAPDEHSPNGNSNSGGQFSHEIRKGTPVMQRSFTPCTCEHCQLCPVARTLARLTSSESGTTTADDTNKNLPPSMTTSDVSLSHLPESYSVEETLQTLKMLTNNNQQMQQEVAAAEVRDIVVAQQIQQQQLYHNQQQQIHHKCQANNHLSQSSHAEAEGDKWDAIEKVLSENIDHHFTGSPTSCKSRRCSRNESKHSSELLGQDRSTGGIDTSLNSIDAGNPSNSRLRRQALEGDKQHNYEQHHSFFVTQALQVGTRRAQVLETLSDDELRQPTEQKLPQQMNVVSLADLRSSTVHRSVHMAQHAMLDSSELEHLDYDDEDDEDLDDDLDDDDVSDDDDDANDAVDCDAEDDDDDLKVNAGMDNNFDIVNHHLQLRHDDVASSELDSSHEDDVDEVPARYHSMTRRRSDLDLILDLMILQCFLFT